MTFVVTDTSVLINLIHVNRLDLLGSLRDHEFLVPREVIDEVEYPSQREILQAGLDNGYVREAPPMDPQELSTFANLKWELGRGESACLAMAQHRSWHVACDERRAFRRIAEERLGNLNRILNTPTILRLAIQNGILTVTDADAIKQELEQRHRFKMKDFSSFEELL
ncbi:MAG: hypothetical protein D6760_10835 [Deltaproteobacteria bacterium]|nr:MAG: hypothetical protein D6760_10835 [Deltaproteobacteria bacterium]